MMVYVNLNHQIFIDGVMDWLLITMAIIFSVSEFMHVCGFSRGYAWEVFVGNSAVHPTPMLSRKCTHPWQKERFFAFGLHTLSNKNSAHLNQKYIKIHNQKYVMGRRKPNIHFNYPTVDYPGKNINLESVNFKALLDSAIWKWNIFNVRQTSRVPVTKFYWSLFVSQG